MNKIFVDDLSLYNAFMQGYNLTFKEKLDISKNLSELNIDTLEIAYPNGDKTEEVLIKTICGFVKPTLSINVGDSIENIENSFSLIKTAKNKRLVIDIPVSPVQMEYSASKKPIALLEHIKNMTVKAVSLNKEVEVCLCDATRAEFDFLLKAVNVALENGASIITVTDETGLVLPSDFAEMIEKIRLNTKNYDYKLYIALNDGFSLAGACMLYALPKGADGVKISEISKTGMLSVDKFCSLIDFVGSKNGFYSDIDKTAINRIVNKISNCVNSQNKPNINVSKEENKNIESSLNIEDLSKIIKEKGYDLSGEDIKKVYSEYKRLSEKKAVNYKDLEAIIATSALQVPETYSLISYSVNSSNILTSTASIVLEKNKKQISGLSFGNGSVDAAFLALENIVGRHFELDDFELGAVTEGKEAVGQAIVKLRNNGKIYSGRGVSTDIIGASIRAYLNALNKIVYEED